MIEDLGIVNDKCEEFNFDFMKIVLYSAVCGTMYWSEGI